MACNSISAETDLPCHGQRQLSVVNVIGQGNVDKSRAVTGELAKRVGWLKAKCNFVKRKYLQGDFFQNGSRCSSVSSNHEMLLLLC